MATITDKVSKLKLATTTSVDGVSKTTSKTFSNINADATDDAVLAAGSSIGSLLAVAPTEVRRVDEVTLEA